jgi:holo-[acyl-carrier protein] synthase
MILGIGSDLCDIRRIEATLARFGTRFTERVFTAGERARSERRAASAASYARRFAAKEACSKALGTGMSRGVFWRDMEVVIHVSLTDDPPLAQAFVVIEARPA